MTDDTSGTLDEALERLHASGPERHGWLSNHAPMAVEALVRHGQGRTVHRWLDRYRDKLEEMPRPYAAITEENWREALGDPRRLADWPAYFERELADHPWQDVLTVWWPRLLPGIAAGATHPVIRVGHAVRTLLDEPGTATAPSTAELAHALGYWAARHAPLPPLRLLPGPASGSAADALAAVEPIADQSGDIRERLARLTAFPTWPPTAPQPTEPSTPRPSRTTGPESPDGLEGSNGPHGPDDPASRTDRPEEARRRLTELVRAATHRYATHGHGEPIMLVHAATAPNAVLRALPALPRELWAPSLDAAWAASAAVTAVYAPAEALPADRLPSVDGKGVTPEEVFAHAAAHGDEHAIKLTDTALDVAGGTDPMALAAALHACAMIDPVL
ncbi:questin oxidase family protein [Streptomyces rhizosphaericus]|uniref:Questin oxidase family protein n=1 Tax=Streptomyces rhizosphaericus TaxID=114699 RepID=A0A6G4AMK2_9ACTN|nr:questin oxidase family protein [Streptomyces rhizosphaericus]NEW74613.1 questin oxidase family protein [Streptomyces rhizosphaericus]